MKHLKSFIYTALFILFLIAVFIGQKNIGYFGLSIMTAGIVGLLVLLYIYNKKFE